MRHAPAWFAAALLLAAALQGCSGPDVDRTIVLFDGSDMREWQAYNGGPSPWKIVQGGLEVAPGKGAIITRRNFRDFQLHVEFLCKTDSPGAGLHGCNSGVYIQNRYEIQIVDSSKEKELRKGMCGAIYGKHAPKVNAAKKPDEWQSFDITFKAARWDNSGKKTANARATVYWNGQLIHDDVEIDDKTGAGKPEGPSNGPVQLQDHKDPVRFRNIWIIPLAD